MEGAIGASFVIAGGPGAKTLMKEGILSAS
jgi:hypothetical protein